MLEAAILLWKRCKILARESSVEPRLQMFDVAAAPSRPIWPLFWGKAPRASPASKLSGLLSDRRELVITHFLGTSEARPSRNFLPLAGTEGLVPRLAFRLIESHRLRVLPDAPLTKLRA